MGMQRLPFVLSLLIVVGCAGQPEQPTTQRQALYGLGERAAEATIAEPDWPTPVTDIVFLLARPDIDSILGVDIEHFRETLTRALLAHELGPQVLNWTPAMADTSIPESQWLLESYLSASGPVLRLSDRELLPYQLKLALRRPGDSAPRWEQTLRGALDATAL